MVQRTGAGGKMCGKRAGRHLCGHVWIVRLGLVMRLSMDPSPERIIMAPLSLVHGPPIRREESWPGPLIGGVGGYALVLSSPACVYQRVLGARRRGYLNDCTSFGFRSQTEALLPNCA